MQRDRRDAGIVELLGEHVGIGARAGEHEGLALTVDHRRQDLSLVAVVDDEHTVVDGARFLVLAGNLVDGGVDQELVDESGDLAVERGREQQLLAAVGRVAENPLHRFDESELAHVVGLVEHRDAAVRQVELALVDEVLDAAGGADHDVDALLQRTDLTPLRDATIDLRGEQADAASDRLHRAVDLQREFARRGEDDRLRVTAELTTLSGLALQDALDQRSAEGDRLTGTGAASSEHVAALQDRRDGRCLNGERRSRTHVAQRFDDVRAEAEVGERRALDLGGRHDLGCELLVDDVFGRLEPRALRRRAVPIVAARALLAVIATRTLAAAVVVVARTVVARAVVARTLATTLATVVVEAGTLATVEPGALATALVATRTITVRAARVLGTLAVVPRALTMVVRRLASP